MVRATVAKTGILIVDKYVADVLSGKQPANKLLRQAVEKRKRAQADDKPDL